MLPPSELRLQESQYRGGKFRGSPPTYEDSASASQTVTVLSTHERMPVAINDDYASHNRFMLLLHHLNCCLASILLCRQQQLGDNLLHRMPQCKPIQLGAARQLLAGRTMLRNDFRNGCRQLRLQPHPQEVALRGGNTMHARSTSKKNR